jgi:hypothetical protein
MPDDVMMEMPMMTQIRKPTGGNLLQSGQTIVPTEKKILIAWDIVISTRLTGHLMSMTILVLTATGTIFRRQLILPS